jgi:hypothetical protein
MIIKIRKSKGTMGKDAVPPACLSRFNQCKRNHEEIVLPFSFIDPICKVPV